MDKISVFPEKIRGGGNILSPKDTTDFELVDASLTKSTIVIDDVIRDIFYLQSAVLGAVTLTVSSSSVLIGGSVTLTATVLDRNQSAVSGASVVFKVNGVQVGTQTTNSSGVATYSYTTDTVGSLTVAAECENYSTGVNYLTVNKHVSAITMAIMDSSIAIGESFELAGTFKIDGTGTSGVHVEVYRDDVLVDTVTTGSGGAWSTSVPATAIGTFKFKAIYAGSSVNASAETSEYTCTVSLNPTNLNITVPALVYSDEFDVTGVLTDGSDNVISGASVKLYMETGGTTTLEATQTTDSNGEVTYHRSAPTSIETYDFWLVYDGDSTYGSVTSSTVEKTVGKETTVLTVSSPSNNASFDSGDSVTVSGTLLTNDSEKLPSGTTVTIKEGGTTLGTANVSTSDGSWSTTISNLSDGSHTLTIDYAESTYYLGSSVTRTVVLVPEATISTLSLVSDKNILSYAGSESATLTATPKTSTNVPIPGLTVLFYSGSPVVADNCTDNSVFTTWLGSPEFSNSGLLIPSTSRVVYTNSIFDLSTNTYKIYLTCTKENTHYLCARALSSQGGYRNSTIDINDTTLTFLDSTPISTPSGLGTTIDVMIEWGPNTQKLYINGDLVATKSISFLNDSDLNYLMFLETTSNEGFTVSNLVIYEDSANDEFVAHAFSDSNGEATCQYDSAGVGDISFTAQSCNILSETYSIEDCSSADTGTTDKHTQWDTSAISDTITYDSTNKCYTFTKISNGDGFARLSSNIIPSSVKVSADIMITNIPPTATVHSAIGLFNPSNNAFIEARIRATGTKGIAIIGFTGSTWGIDTQTNYNISTNTWYRVELIVNDSSITANVYDTNDTLLATVNTTATGYLSTNNKVQFLSTYDNGSSFSLKNVKVKPL